jgi:DNA-directed RNA polymerase specialized sigma24 family protein
VDSEEVRDYVFDKLSCQADPPENLPKKPRSKTARKKSARKKSARQKPHPERWLDNSEETTWAACLEDWCFVVAKNHSLNILRHRGYEQRHVESVEHQNTQRIEHGNRIMESSAHAPSPEEVLERQPRDVLQYKMHRQARHVFDSFGEEAKITSLWIEGLTLQEIADSLDSSVETVRRKLKKLQQAIVAEVEHEIVEEVGEERAEELGVAELLKNLVKKREDLEDLLITDALETSGYEHLPRAAA